MSQIREIKVGLFDDHKIVLDSLINLLTIEESTDVIFAVSSKEALLEKLKVHSVDVILMDVVANDVVGLDLFRTVRKSFPDIRIVAFTGLCNAMLIERLISYNIEGFLSKKEGSDNILKVLFDVVGGKMSYPDEFASMIGYGGLVHENKELTKREEEILLLILDGLLSKEIAEKLRISVNTVENHRSSLFKKFEVDNIAEMIKAANNLGYD